MVLWKKVYPVAVAELETCLEWAVLLQLAYLVTGLGRKLMQYRRRHR